MMNVQRSITAGAIGTAAMTMLMLAAPMMGMPKMPIGEMLGSFTGIGSALGWVMHALIGITLALTYVMFFDKRLPGTAAARGAVYGFLIFLLAQVTVMPMMGPGIFSGGNVMMIMGSLTGHLVYGTVVAIVYAPRVPELAAARP